MSGFRLPGNWCNNAFKIDILGIGEIDFLKSLAQNTFYPFCNDSRIVGRSLRAETEGSFRIIYNKNQRLDLYSVENLDINISAIVGANETGKSTLIDLLLLAFYNISASLNQFENIEDTDISFRQQLSQGGIERQHH